MKNFISYILCLVLILSLNQVQAQNNQISFTQKIVSNEATNWWARSLADINGDGLTDIVLQDDNGYGGWLGWFETGKHAASWTLHIIADSARMGAEFACGDMETADVDNDGDIDIFGFLHGGEYDDKGPTKIYWFENPDWKEHYIGQAPSFIKDVEKTDFNKDGKTDIVVITYAKNTLKVFCQTTDGWKETTSQVIHNLHEGMSVGDIDGDTYPDITTNGYWVKSPGKDITGNWKVQVIDQKWFNQEGNWAKNATKNFCADIEGDGKMEVFITHSERKDYPISWYKLTNPENNTWVEHTIDTLDGCHTLQVMDFDGDGDLDVFAGENLYRWGDDVDPVNLYLNEGDGMTFRKQTLTNQGIYNGLAGDIDQDGDVDIVRLPGHKSNTLEVWLNQSGSD